MLKNQNGIFLLILFLGLFSYKSFGQNTIHQEIEKHTAKIFDSLVEIRRDLHEHPELAGNEKRTSKVIANYLSNLGLEVKTGIAGNGVIGILKGSKLGKAIGWRADMDAIKSDYTDDVPYASTVKGVQHGCGHDVHMAIGLGIAEVLSKSKESLNGTVYFIFQPEEETFVGAKKMISDNVFSQLNMDEIYSLHVTALPMGQVMVKPNEIYAYQKRIQLTFDNDLTKDDAKILYKSIRNEILRTKDEVDHWNFPKVFDSINTLTNPNTIFNDYLFLEENFVVEQDSDQVRIKSYLYETNKSNLPKILPTIEQIINNSEINDHFVSTSYIQENQTVLNDEGLTAKAINSINKIYGLGAVSKSYGQLPYFNDDFFYFQQKIPGVYFLLGGSNSDKGFVAMNHAPNFRVDEECMKIAVQTFSSLIFERTKTE
ncbi:M20 family metallopeptidase [Maribacter chungangensis]|uniref:M20 family metallopeptidase n=1 Tax=Maribacter chungangensis TaxID=1069117 RepID=A0ABW3B186_9FLAO